MARRLKLNDLPALELKVEDMTVQLLRLARRLDDAVRQRDRLRARGEKKASLAVLPRCAICGDITTPGAESCSTCWGGPERSAS